MPSRAPLTGVTVLDVIGTGLVFVAVLAGRLSRRAVALAAGPAAVAAAVVAAFQGAPAGITLAMALLTAVALAAGYFFALVVAAAERRDSR